VKAALAMRSEIARFNAARTEPNLILKVGLHRGAAIAVTFNDRLDYFGQSVNIAARVEALADGGEICLTREVNDAPEVRATAAAAAGHCGMWWRASVVVLNSVSAAGAQGGAAIDVLVTLGGRNGPSRNEGRQHQL
jgi:class 3 adenylate cyclase